MGSIISLGLERFEIDWSKNYISTDHSRLFSKADVATIPYYYADGIVENKEGLSRKLRSVKRRLDLLGYSKYTLPELFNNHIATYPLYYPNLEITFEQFSNILRSLDLDNIRVDDKWHDYDLGEYFTRCLFEQNEFRRFFPSNIAISKEIGAFFEQVDSLIVLRILAENEKNLDRLVQWRYADLVDGGYCSKNEVLNSLPDEAKILVVTEGSTDAFILKRAIDELLPDISDFFHFIDMGNGYPFTGTGSLFNFCKGLAKIRIQNKVLVIFDNDAAGIEKYDLVEQLDKPRNLHICKLPDDESFVNFPTIGPTGYSRQNVNGSAVSIECFLDLEKLPESERVIRWSSYNNKVNRYQGAFDGKDVILKSFSEANLTDGSYDTTKLMLLLDYLVEEWIRHQI